MLCCAVPVPCRRYILELLKSDLKPRDIMNYKAFENAMVTVMATGGSTNAVLHLIAMARAAGVNVTLDDFQRVSDKVRRGTQQALCRGCLLGGSHTCCLWLLDAVLKKGLSAVAAQLAAVPFSE